MSETLKLALKNKLYAQKEEVTDLRERQLLNERLNGINELIDICLKRNRF